MYSHPLVFLGDWFQDPRGYQKSMGAQVPHVKRCSRGGGGYISVVECVLGVPKVLDSNSTAFV